MPQSDTELGVIEKTHALLVWTLDHIAKFPRSHRYGVEHVPTPLRDIANGVHHVTETGVP